MYIPNPLDAFNTYSIHYLMLVCRTTEVAKKFASEDAVEMAESLAAVDRVKALGMPVTINGNSNDVFLVIDTRRFSQFTVESMKYDVLINGLQKGGSTSNLAVDLHMTVLDSVGISFANFMQWLIDEQMKCNYDGLIFMIRTIFVGHHPDGTSETVQSETIPMHLNKMEINLDFAKGAYNLEFMPNMNFDVNRYNRWLTISLATSYKSGKGNTLGGIVTSLEKQLNDTSEDYFKKVQETIQKVAIAGVKDSRGKLVHESGVPLGRKVQYMITIPDSWKNMEVLGANAGGSPELRFVPKAEPPKKDDKTSGQLKETYTTVKPSLIIPRVLDLIFKQTPAIAKAGNFQTAEEQSKPSLDGFITFFKYLVGITSTEDEIMIHVDVVEFKVPNVFAETKEPLDKNTTAVSKFEKEFFITTTSDTGVIKREPRNFVEFDYIFSGKNKDILNFELKIQNFNFLLAPSIRIGDSAIRGGADTGGLTPGEKAVPKDFTLLYTRRYDPLIMPLDTTDALKNFSDYTTHLKTPDQAQALTNERLQYTKNLSTFYGASTTAAAITIKGNPLIMHKFNMGKLLMHPGADRKSSGPVTGKSREEYRENLEAEIIKAGPGYEKKGSSFIPKTSLDEKSYAVSPVYVRINVLGPNVDFRTGEVLPGDYSQSVLSDNFYVVFRVTNIFQGHLFTQELELNAHSIFGLTKITKDDNSIVGKR